MEVKIWHNPNCGSSRAALERLESKGVRPEIYLYLKEPPSKNDLKAVLKRLGIRARDLLRPKEQAAEDLGLYEGASDSKVLAAMAENPRLIQRPIVISAKGAVLARPPLRVDEVL
ncbi:MAG: arsenate reductase (glutaredoxin) [Hyphomonadaceae bacterium]